MNKKGSMVMIVIVIVATLVLFMTGFLYMMWTPIIEETHAKTIDKIEDEDNKDTVATIKSVWHNWPGIVLIGVVLFIVVGAFVHKRNDYGPYQ